MTTTERRAWPLSEGDWRAWYWDRGRTDLTLLLLALWDPIGVNDTPEAADEYENYTADVLQYLPSEDVDGLARDLDRIERVAMGLTPRRNGPPRESAERVIALAWASSWLWAGRPLPD